MKVGDLVEFKRTGTLATVVELAEFGIYGGDDLDKFVRLYVYGDGHFKGLTSMSIEMFKQTAEVINEKA